MVTNRGNQVQSANDDFVRNHIMAEQHNDGVSESYGSENSQDTDEPDGVFVKSEATTNTTTWEISHAKDDKENKPKETVPRDR
jgi:hypothetical protein